jgi:molecular chaperone GrpE
MKSKPEVEPERRTEPVEEPPTEASQPVANDTAGTPQPMPQVDSSGDLAAELEKYKDAALRARAELDNYRKRVAREKEDAIRYANNSLLESLLPILDNFDLGLEAAKTASDASGIVQGLEMVRKQMEDFLREHGVEIVNAVGNPFDPNLHEAVAHEPSSDVADGAVVRQLRRGFKLKDRLIRPASVVVSKGPRD